MAHSHTAVSTWLTCTPVVSTQCFFYLRTLFGCLTLLFTCTFVISLIPLSNLHSCRLNTAVIRSLLAQPSSLHSRRLNTAIIWSLLTQPFAMFKFLLFKHTAV
ncbi:hypothetical protein FB446DRAFT_718187 [Lentinula raphanica]|nr:hypothetical protein FB446DRAFT_718187 [Lentinula raphanica]